MHQDDSTILQLPEQDIEKFYNFCVELVNPDNGSYLFMLDIFKKVSKVTGRVFVDISELYTAYLFQPTKPYYFMDKVIPSPIYEEQWRDLKAINPNITENHNMVVAYFLTDEYAIILPYQIITKD